MDAARYAVYENNNMTYALNSDGDLIEAIPHAEYLCPNCKRKVFSKCGEVRIWHWSHHISESCELSKIIDSVWRYNWIKKASKQKVEKILNGYSVDILGNNNSKIMFVGTKIDINELVNREKAFKDRIIWVLKADGIRSLKFYSHNYGHDNKDTHYSFVWQRTRKEWLTLNKEISFLFFDVGESMKYYRDEYDSYSKGFIASKLLYVKDFNLINNTMMGSVVEMKEEYFIERYM